MRLEDLIIEPLGEHDRAAFSCGKPPLDEYLKTQAGQDHKRDLARTFVLVDPTRDPSRVIGYYSLAATGVDLSRLPPEQAKGVPYPVVPCLLLGRLALDQAYHGQGLGAFLLDRALRHCLSIAQQVGARAVIVDALDEQARKFYEAYGFRPLPGTPGRLFLPVKDIAHAVRAADRKGA